MLTVADYCAMCGSGEWKFFLSIFLIFFFFWIIHFEMRPCPFHNNCASYQKNAQEGNASAVAYFYNLFLFLLWTQCSSLLQIVERERKKVPRVRLICHFSQVFNQVFTGYEFDWFNRLEPVLFPSRGFFFSLALFSHSLHTFHNPVSCSIRESSRI